MHDNKSENHKSMMKSDGEIPVSMHMEMLP